MECPGRQESLGGWRMGAAQLFSGMWETTIFYNGTEVKVSSTNGPAWSVNRFYLMVRRRGIKCVHLPDLFLSDGNMKERHQMCSPTVDPPCVGEDVQCFQTYLVNF